MRKIIISLVGCGWIWVFNSSINFKQEPLSKWEQIGAFDTATECEDAKSRVFVKELEHNPQMDIADHVKRNKCVPVDVVYPQTEPQK